MHHVELMVRAAAASRRALVSVCLALALPASLAAAEQFDVAVYRATAGGAIAAIAAARAGSKVVVIEAGQHVGGMVSGGLGRTDMDRQQRLIGGLAGEFFARVGKRYNQPLAWFFEPKVAEAVFREWLAESGVTVRFGRRLASVKKDGGRITSLLAEDGSAFEARVFIDASYEGDLLKAAGVSYAVGRESRAKFGEALAGRQDILPGRHQFRVATPALGDNGQVLPYLAAEDLLKPTGEGDGLVQAWGFRLCLTNDAANRIEITKPEGYDPRRFGLVKNYLKALGADARLNDFLGISKMPNNKTDVNAGGGVSTNLPGAGLAYIEASPARRREIWEEHRSWAHGLLYFLGHDESVPEALRAQVRAYGLARDEFADTGHWPHQLYIRDARRMAGEYILTERDLLRETTKYDSIGMGQYNIDIREVQWIAKTVYRFPNAAKEALMEGYVSAPVEPYEIPYRALLPKYGECANLLVPVALSASHVAYASFRMEPQYMIAGHAAGAAASAAAKEDVAVHRVSITRLQEALRRQGQVLSLRDAPK